MKVATKKSRKTETQLPEDDVNVLQVLVRATQENPQRGLLALLGPTQWGKTYFVRQLPTVLKMPLVILNPQLQNEDELGGLPIRLEAEGRVIYSEPPAFTTAFKSLGVNPAEPYIVFWDELDKARHDVLTCLLTAFSEERRIREFSLKNAYQICAMNEPKRDLPDPLLARLLLVPFPLNEQYYNEVPNGEFIHQLHPLPEITFPARPNAPGSSYKLMEWYDVPEFWDYEAVKLTVVRGLYDQKDVPSVLEKLSDVVPDFSVDWIKKASPSLLGSKLLYALTQQKDALGKKAMMEALWERAKNDATGEVGRIWNALVQNENIYETVGRDTARLAEGTKLLLQGITSQK